MNSVQGRIDSRFFTRTLTVIVAVGVASRLVWNTCCPLRARLFADMATYNEVAINLAHGRSDWKAGFFPLGTAALAAAAWLIGQDIAVTVGWNLIGVGVALATWRLACASGCSPRASRWLGLYVAVSPLHTSLSNTLLSEAPFSFALTAGCALWANGKTRTALVLMSLASLLRPQLLIGLIILAIWLGYKRKRRLAYYTIAAATGSCLAVAGSQYFATGSAGFPGNAHANLALGACPGKAAVLLGREGEVRFSYQPPAHVQNLGTTGRISIREKGRGYGKDGFRQAALECIDGRGVARDLGRRAFQMRWLFFGNTMWPDSADRDLSKVANFGNTIFLGMLVSLGVIRLKSAPYQQSCHRNCGSDLQICALFSLVAASFFFFSSVRLRIPYEPVMLVLLAGTRRWALSKAGHPERQGSDSAPTDRDTAHRSSAGRS